MPYFEECASGPLELYEYDVWINVLGLPKIVTETVNILKLVTSGTLRTSWKRR